MYLTDNWRAFRTWGVSAISPWEYGHFWKLRDGVDQRRKELPVDWENLQRPGFSPDYIDQRYERMDLAFERIGLDPDRRRPGPAAQQPAAAGLHRRQAGAASPARTTTSCPGETVEKQLIVINNSRETVTCDCRWSLAPAASASSRSQDSSPWPPASRNASRCASRCRPTLAAGPVRSAARPSTFSTGETQKDSFTIHVLPADRNGRRPARMPDCRRRIALFDPKGETTRAARRAGRSRTSPSTPATDLSAVRHADRRQGGADRRRPGAATSTAFATV